MNSIQRRKKARIERRFARRMIMRYEKSVMEMCTDPRIPKVVIVDAIQSAINEEKSYRGKS
ncbi:hypothetical protein [Nitrosomonas ureae]|uniref:Uncharacterized protein n=1 Tax=Nitrosomonas ureae TaxID=44577 RepID=A0A286A295_9PROT|nr:hypothetical protein [Nitrosomonas ureae]SOD16032.1 hypothetical protein SAMN06297164_0199 [Nitrosomonas ureae]